MDFEEAQESLFFAVYFFDRQRKTSADTVRKAIAEGADINGYDNDGDTPLTAAIAGGEGSPAAVELLLELGANPDLRNRQGYTPWGICLERLGDPVVEEKMAKIKETLSPHVNDRSDEQISDLEDAINNRDITRIRQLLQSMNVGTLKAFSPLTYAVDTGNLEVTRFLLKSGYEAGFNERNEPIAFYPAIRGDRAMIELLLENGADLQAYADDDPTQTCEAAARMNDHVELAEWIKRQAGGKEPRG